MIAFAIAVGISAVAFTVNVLATINSSLTINQGFFYCCYSFLDINSPAIAFVLNGNCFAVDLVADGNSELVTLLQSFNFLIDFFQFGMYLLNVSELVLAIFVSNFVD